MTVYPFRATVVTASGSTSTITLDIMGGLCRQVYIEANTLTTVFLANLKDKTGLKVMDWGAHTGVLNDIRLSLPVAGRYTLSITNATPDDTFKVFMGVQE